MTTTWVLIANASEASLYKAQKGHLLNNSGELELVRSFSHPESRLKDTEITSDRSGHYQGKNTGHGDFVEPTDPKESESLHFAKELASALEAGRKSNAFEALIIAAPPHFHGLPNKEINGELSKSIWLHIKKDYTKDNDRQLMAHLGEHL